MNFVVNGSWITRRIIVDIKDATSKERGYRMSKLFSLSRLD